MSGASADWIAVALAATGSGVFTVGADGRVRSANSAAERLADRPATAMLGRPVRALIPAWPMDPPHAERAPEPEGWEAWLNRPDRTVVPIRLTVLLTGRAGDALQIGAFRDITPQLEAEQGLRESQRRFETLIQRAPDAFLVAVDDRVRFANPALARLLGHGSGDYFVGRSLHELAGAEGLESVRRALAGETVHDVELAVRHREGLARYVDAVWTRTDYEGRPAVLGMWRDTTASRDLRSKMAQTDRLASLGLLAASIAHEINNPLTSVLHNLDFLANASRGGDPEVAHATAQAVDGAHRIRRIARGLTTFARVDSDEPSAVPLKGVLEDAIRLAEPEIRPRAALRAALGPSRQRVVGNAGALAQVFLNMLINAAHAIGDGGDPELDEVVVAVRTSGEEVHVEVRDSGCGIPRENLERLFEPLFTTKPSGVGSGLGLPICLNIVQSCGGRIEVESEVGQGSCFRVVLRDGSHLDEHGLRILTSGEMAIAAGHQARILVIDDDDAVRESVQRILEVGGHHVTSAGSGLEGRALLQYSGLQFDLVFTDLMMAQGSGIELFEWMQDHRAALIDRVVFMTGGAYDAASREFLARVTTPRLTKPFDPSELLEFVIERIATLGFVDD